MNDHKTRLMKSLQYGIPDDKDAKNLVERLHQYEADCISIYRRIDSVDE